MSLRFPLSGFFCLRTWHVFQLLKLLMPKKILLPFASCGSEILTTQVNWLQCSDQNQRNIFTSLRLLVRFVVSGLWLYESVCSFFQFTQRTYSRSYRCSLLFVFICNICVFFFISLCFVARLVQWCLLFSVYTKIEILQFWLNDYQRMESIMFEQNLVLRQR